MNKITLAVVGLFLLAFASCDYNAGTPVHSEESGFYYGNMYVQLYTPDRNVELNNMNFAMPEGELAQSVVWSVIDVDVQDASSMKVELTVPDTIQFALPFLEKKTDGTRGVRECFADGAFAALYDNLHSAADKGWVDADTFRHFEDMIQVLRDTIVLSDLSFDYSVTEFGNSLISYDFEKNSTSSNVNLSAYEYERHTNLKEVMQFIKPTIEKLHDMGLITDELIQTLKTVSTNDMSGTMSNNLGYCRSAIAQYCLSFMLNIYQSDGFLKDLAVALYGRDSETGEPRHDLWLVIQYEGDLDLEFN